MLTNYVKIALRNVNRHKGYAALNLVGLAVGLACFLLMALYVQYEWSYDRHLPHADRIYRMTLQETSDGQTLHRAVTPPALAPTLKRDFPVVQQVTRFGVMNAPTLIAGGQRFSNMPFAFADSTFFTVFQLPFLHGAPETALTHPNGIVLTRSAAQAFFGTDDVLGRHLRTPEHPTLTEALTVTGVIENIPPNTHFTFDLLVSRPTLLGDRPTTADDQWWFYGGYTYILLPEAGQTLAARLNEQLPLLSERYLSDRPGISIRFQLQPMTSIHLHSHLDKELQPNSRAAYVYLLGGVGLLILLIACINFMNLATARATRRAREVGVRKVVGAGRRQLIMQFLAESMLLVSLATVLALGLAGLGLPVLEHLAGVTLPVRGPVLRWLVPGLPLLMLGVGALAGSYPAFVLSAFRPTVVLKQRGPGRATWDVVVRKGLVVVQFAASVALIIGTGVVYQQITFMQQADLGFDKEHLVSLSVSTVVPYDPETVRQAFMQHPGIQEVGFSRFVPTEERLFANGSPIPEGAEHEVPVYWHVCDANYMKALGLQLVEGRDFSNLTTSDTTGAYRAFIVNETAVKRFGWTGPIGKALLNPFNREPMGRVIGVVADFHQTSLQQEIEPLVYFLSTEARSFRRILVRLRPGHTQDALAFMEQQWTTFAPGRPFSFFFLDASYEALYRAEERLNRIIGSFAGLAIFVACLGLFGLAAFTTEQRTKEVGIRKVLGASAPHLVALLSKDFLKLVALAFVVAVPLAYVLMHRWLEGFAYRIDISWPIFLIVGLVTLGIALLTVSFQAVRAALADPVKSLRYE